MHRFLLKWLHFACKIWNKYMHLYTVHHQYCILQVKSPPKWSHFHYIQQRGRCYLEHHSWCKWETVQLTLSSVGIVTDLLQVLTEWCTGRMPSSERRICNFLLNEALIFSVVGSLSQLSPRNETCIFCLVQTKAITLKSKSRNRNPGLFFVLFFGDGLWFFNKL